MKNTLLVLFGLIFLSTPLAATAQGQSGDFYYEFSDSGLSAVTIVGYTGPGGAVTIPAGLWDDDLQSMHPVKHIGYSAFGSVTTLTSVTIPSSVTSIGDWAFAGCTNLTSVTIPGSVTTIGGYAFAYSTRLTNITIPGSITVIPNAVFASCSSLQGVFFKGNAPNLVLNVFDGATNAIVYYLPGATRWGATFAGRPAVLWNPRVQTGDASFGVGSAGFGFNITGTADIPIVVEASTTLAHDDWVRLQSLNLTNGAFYFSDHEWTNFPARNYRIRSP